MVTGALMLGRAGGVIKEDAMLSSTTHALVHISCICFTATSLYSYPEEMPYFAPRYRGRIVLTRDPDGLKSAAYPATSAPSLVRLIASACRKTEEEGRWYPEFFRINFSRCIFCGFCEEACPTYADPAHPGFRDERI